MERRGARPILLDLNGKAVKFNEISRSTRFIDSGDDGLLHRTASAGAGDGVLFYDTDNSGTLSEKREFVFTGCDPTARTDMESLRCYFDSNCDGKLICVRPDRQTMTTVAAGAKRNRSAQRASLVHPIVASCRLQ